MQLLQIDVPTEALEPEVTESTLSILSLMTNGGIGAQIIMSILFIMSIMAIYLFVSRLSAIKRSSQMDSKFMDDIKDYITNGNLQSATNLCERSDTPVGRMLAKGIRRIGKPLQDISASIENQGKLEIQRLERNLPYLATISGGAPMLGFLGTVIGMILSFKEMANAGGGVQVDMMAEGIY
ncbi:MAG: MotA/TolQ/ExbB proton channel family protein, partial [Schleiferiaceae bacterium]|nr:MotA/TolQ/ExbB proton channel family protein [Schleiferiaceae bacterium]